MYSNGCGGWGSSSTDMAEADPCWPLVPPAAEVTDDEGASVSAKTSGSEGRRSLSNTNPDGADFTGT